MSNKAIELNPGTSNLETNWEITPPTAAPKRKRDKPFYLDLIKKLFRGIRGIGFCLGNRLISAAQVLGYARTGVLPRLSDAGNFIQLTGAPQLVIAILLGPFAILLLLFSFPIFYHRRDRRPTRRKSQPRVMTECDDNWRSLLKRDRRCHVAWANSLSKETAMLAPVARSLLGPHRSAIRDSVCPSAGSTQDESAFDLDRRANQSLCAERALAALRTGLCLEILQAVRPRVATHRRDSAGTHDSDDRGEPMDHQRYSERSQSDAQRRA
jgi:hypothetical protein